MFNKKKKILPLIILSLFMANLFPIAAFADVSSQPSVNNENEPSIIYLAQPTDDEDVFRLVATDARTRSIIDPNAGRIEVVWMPTNRSVAISITFFDHPGAKIDGKVYWYTESGKQEDVSTFETYSGDIAVVVDCPFTHTNELCTAEVIGVAHDWTLGIGAFSHSINFYM